MPGGRPTEYKGEETIRLAEEYLAECIDSYENAEDSKELLGDKLTKTKFVKKLRVKLPKVEGLALKLDISRATLYEWAQKHPEFQDILEKVNKEQADRLINNSLSSEYNSNIAKLLLGKHGYKESAEYEITTPKPLLDAIQDNNGNKKDNADGKKNKSSTGRNSSVKDDKHTAILDTSVSDRQE